MTRHPTSRLQRIKLKRKYEEERKDPKAGKIRKQLKASIEEKETKDVLQFTRGRDPNLDG